LSKRTPSGKCRIRQSPVIYYIRLTAWARVGDSASAEVNFPLVLEADGFDDEGDWRVVGHYFTIREGHWRIYKHVPNTVFLENKKDSTWDTIVGSDYPWAMAILHIDRFPFQVGDSGTGNVILERSRLVTSNTLKWTVNSRA
jgi:hypothetical protein